MNTSDCRFNQIVGHSCSDCCKCYCEQFPDTMGYISSSSALQNILEQNSADIFGSGICSVSNDETDSESLLIQPQSTHMNCLTNNSGKDNNRNTSTQNNLGNQEFSNRNIFACSYIDCNNDCSNINSSVCTRLNGTLPNNMAAVQSTVCMDQSDNTRESEWRDINNLNKSIEKLTLADSFPKSSENRVDNLPKAVICSSQSMQIENAENIKNKMQLPSLLSSEVADNVSNSSNEEIYYDCFSTEEPKQECEMNESYDDKYQKVRRSSSLKTNKNVPNSSAHKKIVRFADALGLDLADVRTFLDEIPSIPKSAYDDLDEMEIPPVRFADLSKRTELQSPKFLVPMFHQPVQQVFFLDKVRENNVCLEKVAVPECHVFSINGVVRVRNLDFHKSVYVRYTTDNWCSFSEIQATYIQNSCDGFSDQFSFTIYLYNLSIGQRVELVIRFHCLGSQFWDNNNGLNYVFHCLATPCAQPNYNNYGTASVPLDVNIPSSFY